METPNSKILSGRDEWEKIAATAKEARPPSHFAVESEKKFPCKANILEIGGGVGFDASFFLKKGHFVTSIDISRTSLDGTREKAEALGLENHLTTMQSDLNQDSILFKDDVFDVVFSRLGLHYFSEERTAEIFTDVKRVLKEGGKAFFRVKSPKDKAEMQFLESVSEKLGEGLYTQSGVMRTRFSEATWKSITKEAGMDDALIRTIQEESTDNGMSAASGNHSFLLTEITFTK